MATVADFSFGHGSITPDALRKVDGCVGGIAYAGCADTSKNITKAELHALLDAGFQMGLVIENVATDAINGAPVGTSQGKAIWRAAADLGYDRDNCVLFGGYDTNAGPADYPHLLAYMEAFAAEVAHPGYYGDSDSIDYLHDRHPHWAYWQSDSRSFSPRNPTPNAHLLQNFADRRAHGLPVDVNDVLRTPVGLMGEPKGDELSQQEVDEIKAAIADIGAKVDSGFEKVLNLFRADNGHRYREQTFLERIKNGSFVPFRKRAARHAAAK